MLPDGSFYKISMTAKEKLTAEEQKEEMYYEVMGRCKHCGKSLQLYGGDCQLAHKIPKGYVRIYGKEIIHHKKNMDITCSGCNSKSLLDPKTHPIEAEALIQEIKEELYSGKCN